MEYPMDGAVKPTVLVVDDMPDNLSLMVELLKNDYKVKLANMVVSVRSNSLRCPSHPISFCSTS